MKYLYKHNRLRIFQLLILVFVSTNIHSQILDINGDGLEGDTSKSVVFKSIISLDAETAKQQNMVVDLASQIEAAMVFKNRDATVLSSKTGLTFNGSESLLNSGYFHLRHLHAFKNKVHPEYFCQYQWDAVRGMKNRLVGGMNVRFNVYVDSSLSVNLGTGLFYEDELWGYNSVPDYRLPLVTNDINNRFIKSNSYLRVRWEVGSLTILFTNYLQLRPDSYFKYPRLATTFILLANLGNNLTWSFGFNSIYDFMPIVPIDNFYFNATNGLALTF